MTTCNICGSEKACYDFWRKQTICPECAKTTPHKLNRAKFDERYWNDPTAEKPPRAIMADFYDDYRASSLCFDDYRAATSREAM